MDPIILTRYVASVSVARVRLPDGSVGRAPGHLMVALEDDTPEIVSMCQKPFASDLLVPEAVAKQLGTGATLRVTLEVVAVQQAPQDQTAPKPPAPAPKRSHKRKAGGHLQAVKPTDSTPPAAQVAKAEE